MRDERIYGIYALTDPANIGKVYERIGQVETRRLFVCVRASEYAPMVIMMIGNGDGHPPYVASTKPWERDEFRYTGRKVKIELV
jgi:hypothetical protein